MASPSLEPPHRRLERSSRSPFRASPSALHLDSCSAAEPVERGGPLFLIDDILFSPVSGILWVFREIFEAAQGEAQGEKERLTDELSQLYMQLETGQLTEQAFDEREKEVLDRLDELEAEAREEGERGLGDEEEEEEEDEDDEEAEEETPEGEGGKGRGA